MKEREWKRSNSKSFSPELLAKLQSETQPQVPKMESKHLQFVVILVDEADPQEIPVIISRVIDTLLRQRAIVSDITCSLVVGLLGAPFPEGNSPEERRELVDALLQENGHRIRIVHGECDAPFGIFGGQKRCTYGALIPGFSRILKKLVETSSGTAVEIDSTTPSE
jgi:hypothetical protein